MSTAAAAVAAQPDAAAAAPLPRVRIGASANRVSFAPRLRSSKAALAAAAAEASASAVPSYALDTAVGLVRACASADFDETVSVSLKLNLDPRKPNQSVRGAVVLPHGTGKTVRVAVFAKGEKAQEALAAGADIVGEKDLVDQILAGKILFERCIATPDMMAFVGRVARILGPRGLMPNPKVGTVTSDVGAAVKAAKQGSVEFKTDQRGLVQAPVGKASFTRAALAANVEAFVERIVDLKPSAAPKGAYIVSATVASTQGPGVLLDLRAAPFKASAIGVDAATSSGDARRGLAAMGAYGRMHSVNGFDVVRYDLGAHPSQARVEQAKGKWPLVKEQIKRSRADKDSWATALKKVEAINSSPALAPRKPAAAAAAPAGKGAKPASPAPSTAGKTKEKAAPAAADAAAGEQKAAAAKAPKPAKAPKEAGAATPAQPTPEKKQ